MSTADFEDIEKWQKVNQKNIIYKIFYTIGSQLPATYAKNRRLSTPVRLTVNINLTSLFRKLLPRREIVSNTLLFISGILLKKKKLLNVH